MPDLSHLNQEQLQAVTHGEGPILIIAGAGTGKTTVITKRIEYLILEKNISPKKILALTFTEKAAKEMETRIDEVLPYGYTDLWIETFHAFCDRILRQEALHLGLSPDFQLMTEAEALLFLRKNIFSFELKYFRPLSNPSKFLQGLLQHFSRLKDDDITPEDYLNFAVSLSPNDYTPDEIEKINELAKSFDLYEKIKKKNNVMDFSDLISTVLTLFRTRPHILSFYQKQFEFILVDEFQDTNYAQNELAILLSGVKKNITVVGDDDQSIYRWRGAAIANMIQFKDHFPNASIVALTKNYRSTQSILDNAYTLIQHNNPDRLEVKEKINKKLTAESHTQGDGSEFLYATRGEDEAELVAKKIKDEIQINKRSPKDFAILVRANDHALPFQKMLEKINIPTQFLGPSHLFEQEEIKDLIAYLKVLVNFDDDASLYRVLTMNIFSIDGRDIAALFNFAKKNNYSLFETLEQFEEININEKTKKSVKKIVTMIKNHLEKVPSESAGQILYYFFEDSGLLNYYLDPQNAKTENQALNIASFFNKLQRFSNNRQEVSVFAVVEWLELSMELGESPLATESDWSNNDAVNILTIHSSKGLEFPVVFVVNLVTQRFPSRDRREQIPIPSALIKEELPTGDENLQEERRLFYVAITRAKEKLFLTAAKYYGEGKRERKLSPFIEETLGKDYIHKVISSLTSQPESSQLSLLDVFNTKIEQNKGEEKEEKFIKSHTLTYISYSQIQTFQICPLHYKLQYLLNIPTQPSPSLSFGISVHNTLRDFFLLREREEKIKPNIILTLLEKAWLKRGYTSKEHALQAYKQAESILLPYSQDILTSNPETLVVELPFQFWLNKVKVGGRIDRVDQLKNGQIEIIDYKTGPNIPDDKKIQKDLQLTFYALAATEIKDEILHRLPEDIILTLHYIELNKSISTTRSTEDLIRGKEEILKIINEIETSNFSCSKSILCNSCDYKMICGQNS